MMKTVGDKVRDLRERLKDYPVPKECRSFAGRQLYAGADFFPAALGLHDPMRHSVSTIVLGTDWGNEDDFREWCERSERKQMQVGHTLGNTKRVLERAGFNIDDCFLSNAWPLMRVGSARAMGHHSMRDNAEITNAYREYLRHTLRDLDIKLVITLGHACAWFVGPIVGQDWPLTQLKSWRDVTIERLDEDPLRVRNGVVFVNATHPSFMVNSKKRWRLQERYRDEIGLLSTARQQAGIPSNS